MGVIGRDLILIHLETGLRVGEGGEFGDEGLVGFSDVGDGF